VKVTRRDHITIPASLRKQFGIKEGDQLVVEATEQGILFKTIPETGGHGRNRFSVWYI
jgi:AbrB family looped-hinge helix DNA binding protein